MTTFEKDLHITPDPIQDFNFEGINAVIPYHTHNGIDSPRIVPESSGGLKSCTFIIAPVGIPADYTTDGVDDDVQIQAAIDALPTNGGRIIFREGTYTLGAVVTIAKNGVTLQGQGKGTIIQAKNSLNANMIQLGSNTTQYFNCVIKDIYFDGRQSQQGSGTIIYNGALTYPIDNLEVLDCYLVNAFDACIQLLLNGAATNSNLIEGNYFQNWKGGATRAAIITTDCLDLITHNTFINTDTAADYIQSGSQSIIKGNMFFIPNTYAGTVVDGGNITSDNYFTMISGSHGTGVIILAGLTCNNNNFFLGSVADVLGDVIRYADSISGNFIDGGGTGIRADSLSNVTGNALWNLRGDGIDATSADLTIVGNIINNAGRATNNTYSAILLLGSNNSKTVVSGNRIRSSATNKPQYGIRENTSGTTAGNVITNNVVYNAVTAQISTQNTSTVVAHNITV